MNSVSRALQRALWGAPRAAGRAGPPRRILVIRRNGIGDMVCALPCIRALKRAHPNAFLSVLASRENAAVARLCEAADEVLTFPLGRPLVRGRGWQTWTTARALRRMDYDLTVAVSGSYSSLLARLAYGSGAPTRVGTVSAELASDPYAYTHFRVRADGSRTHQVLTGVELMKSIGVACDPNEIHVRLPEEKIRAASEWLRSRVGEERPRVWLHVSNNRPQSRWGENNFRELTERLLRETSAAVVIGVDPRDDATDRDKLPAESDRVVRFENPSFHEFAAALGRSQAIVCGDGGVMHLGAALDVPTVALFGGTDPEIWRPWGARHISLKKGDRADLIAVEEVLESTIPYIPRTQSNLESRRSSG